MFKNYVNRAVIEQNFLIFLYLHHILGVGVVGNYLIKYE